MRIERQTLSNTPLKQSLYTYSYFLCDIFNDVTIIRQQRFLIISQDCHLSPTLTSHILHTQLQIKIVRTEQQHQ